MACSHATTCPLFPKLNASLSGWRESYCDTADKWQSCARHKRSLAGDSVPLGLLPNGRLLGGSAALAAEPRPAVAARVESSAGDPAPAVADQAGRSWWARLVATLRGGR